jgi:hypothetical protein
MTATEINWKDRYRTLLAETKDSTGRADAAQAQANLEKAILKVDGEAVRLVHDAAVNIRDAVERTENQLLKKALLQPSLFLDDLWIDCGESDRFLLGDMTVERWQRRKNLRSSGFAAQASAFGTEIAFIDDQMQRLGNDPSRRTRNLY